MPRHLGRDDHDRFEARHPPAGAFNAVGGSGRGFGFGRLVKLACHVLGGRIELGFARRDRLRRVGFARRTVALVGNDIFGTLGSPATSRPGRSAAERPISSASSKARKTVSTEWYPSARLRPTLNQRFTFARARYIRGWRPLIGRWSRSRLPPLPLERGWPRRSRRPSACPTSSGRRNGRI